MARASRVEITHNDFPKMGPELRRAADREAEITARSILSGAQVAMSEPKHGREYPRGDTVHIASAPGEAPAVDTGALRASGYVKQVQPGTWEVGFTAEYAAALEYGTPRIEPRPYLRPEVEKHRDGFMGAIRRPVGQ